MGERNNPHVPEYSPGSQHEDAALKTTMQFFADELLPYLGIEGRVTGFAPTELVQLEIRKLFQDFNLVMEDGTWKHFEFQSTNEGIAGLKRFRVYESTASYQHKVSITTYVLYSGTIQHPMTEFTEGVNTYRIVPIILQDKNADQLLQILEEKLASGQNITRQDLVPITLCPLMGGTTSQKDRIKAAFAIVRSAQSVPRIDVEKIEAVIYAMAEKFLDTMSLEEVREGVRMTKLGKMMIDEGIETAKIENARNLIDLLSEEIIAERIGLPLEKVKQIKKEMLKKA